MNSKDRETKGTHVNKLGCQWGCTMSSESFQLLTRLSSTFLRIKSVWDLNNYLINVQVEVCVDFSLCCGCKSCFSPAFAAAAAVYCYTLTGSSSALSPRSPSFLNLHSCYLLHLLKIPTPRYVTRIKSLSWMWTLSYQFEIRYVILIIRIIICIFIKN